MSQVNSKTMTGYRIRVIRQSASPIEFALEDGRSVFIGRGESCGIQVKGDSIANIHCLIDVSKDDVSIQDWASDAGTIVNGKAIDEKTAIWVGDSIVIGSISLELVGKSSGQNSRVSPSGLQPEESLEESVGMENIGYDTIEDESLDVESPNDETSGIDIPQREVEASLSRLSDSFEAGQPDQQSSEKTEDEIVEPAEAEDSAERSALTSPIEPSPIEPSARDSETNSSVLADPDDGRLDREFEANLLTAEDLDWDPTTFDDDQVDAEIVQLLKSEIEDLRIQVAERDEQLAAMREQGYSDTEACSVTEPANLSGEFESTELVQRVDDLLAELSEHDERVSTLQDLLQMAEIQNQSEREERNCLETWVSEIEQRIGDRESEWQAEQDALRGRLESVCEERDQAQQHLHAASKRYGKASVEEVVPDDTLEKLQKQNAELQTTLEDAQKQVAIQDRRIESLQSEDPESLQAERAELAQQKAATSRMRFQLSKQLQDIGNVPDAKDQPDREFAFKLQTLREHLREIHEEEKHEREQKSESLLGRISNLWKRVDDEF